jgi:hypothetical protein
MKAVLIVFGKQFKELIMSIDQEENKIDENKAGNPKALEPSKLSVLQQKLLDGIEKTKVKNLKRGFIYKIDRLRKKNVI